MAATLAAGVVVLLHLAFLVYAVLGGFLALRNRLWLWPHVATTMWCLTVTLTGVTCPLTRLEKWLITLGGQTPYEASFTAHYLRDVVYPTQYETAVWLAGIAFAVLSYVIVLRTPQRVVAAPAT
ncbi:MAG: hypothetical protein AVDCRST_MAG16-3058 [uncultured Frankineae bacterium]|uniref:DUF2784 domain-containing protein n=1 Tax=uncultured Frankineae bacterium TaxID=437475 RepID=A0A6J4MJC7_9ACTN|nr:MAG: hypothetical protein AVDCRST_MAG16-3058 [uncultured Frankineae bacterium]